MIDRKLNYHVFGIVLHTYPYKINDFLLKSVFFFVETSRGIKNRENESDMLMLPCNNGLMRFNICPGKNTVAKTCTWLLIRTNFATPIFFFYKNVMQIFICQPVNRINNDENAAATVLSIV